MSLSEALDLRRNQLLHGRAWHIKRCCPDGARICTERLEELAALEHLLQTDVPADELPRS